MPMRMEPFTFLMCSAAVTRTPTTHSSALMPLEVKFSRKSTSSTSVAPPTHSPAFCRPMKAMNKPMPTDTPRFRLKGMALKMASRMLVRDSTTKIRPSTKTASSATCQG